MFVSIVAAEVALNMSVGNRQSVASSTMHTQPAHIRHHPKYFKHGDCKNHLEDRKHKVARLIRLAQSDADAPRLHKRVRCLWTQQAVDEFAICTHTNRLSECRLYKRPAADACNVHANIILGMDQSKRESRTG